MESLCEPSQSATKQAGAFRYQMSIGRAAQRQAQPFGPAVAGNGHMIALLAANRATIDRAHATALAHGGACEGPPGLRPQYHANYYGAYFRDPDGNKLCVCCHEPEPPATPVVTQASH